MIGINSLSRGEDMARPEILKCVLCGKEYSPEPERYVCGTCGLDGTLDVLYDVNEAKKRLMKDSLSLSREERTGSTRRISSSADTSSAPGRDEAPPRSSTSAPCP